MVAREVGTGVFHLQMRSMILYATCMSLAPSWTTCVLRARPVWTSIAATFKYDICFRRTLSGDPNRRRIAPKYASSESDVTRGLVPNCGQGGSRFAWVTTLFGTSREYCLETAVMGLSLRNKTTYELVLLHRPDVTWMSNMDE